MKNNKTDNKTKINIVNSGTQHEIVQRYGSAAKEHIVAYTGIDQETGIKLEKGLKDIAKSKLNPEYQQSNIKQQSGFSAEVKTVARENAEKIIKGENKRTIRTDDMTKQSDGRGHTVGGKNEQLYDIGEIDKNGVYIEGSARQLKYVGGNAKQCTDKILGKKFDKYRDADIPLDVPSDFYDDVQNELTNRIEKVKKSIEKAEKNEDSALLEKQKAHLEKLEKTKRNLKKGKLSNKEAIEARVHPLRSTIKDIHKISHKAGVEGAKIGAAVGGGISTIQNIVAVVKGDKEADDAIIDVTKDTTKSVAMGYATNYIGSAVKGAMQNAPNTYLQSLSKTNLPATIVTSVVEVGKTLKKLGTGEIDGTECLVELGEKGTGMIASSMGAVVGTAVIPIPVVGSLVGSMIGYAMSSAFYNNLVSSLQDAKIAYEERLRIEQECKDSIAAIKKYQNEIEKIVNNYMHEHMIAFNESFSEMEKAYCFGNIDDFIKNSNKLTTYLGGEPVFKSLDDFDKLMEADQPIKL